VTHIITIKKSVHENSPKMSTRIHQNNVHEKSPQKRNSRGQKCPREFVKSVHENSPILSTRIRLFSQLLKTSFNWENFSWLTHWENSQYALSMQVPFGNTSKLILLTLGTKSSLNKFSQNGHVLKVQCDRFFSMRNISTIIFLSVADLILRGVITNVSFWLIDW
jgi:hypothetical protein